MLFVTNYEVIGSRCTGSYLVNAENKRQANKIVKAFDPDYCRVNSQTQKEFLKLYDEEDWNALMENIPIPVEGQASHIESGT